MTDPYLDGIMRRLKRRSEMTKREEMTDTKPTLSVEDAVKLLNQERLDIMCEGATQEDCEMQPAYVVLSAYNETKASLLRCQEIVHEKDRELAALRGRLMDLICVDSLAWSTFINEYDRYSEGDPSVPFSELRNSLAIVIESAVALKEGK